jgi:hypothetical protein
MLFPATPFRQNAGAVSASLNKALVSAYKVVGFGLLTVILMGIVGYVTLHSFYLVHHAWVAPTVLSPSDPAVLDLRARLAHEDWMRQKVLVERAALEAQLRKAKRVAELEEAFRKQFKRAMRKDAAARRRSLEQLGRLGGRQEKIDRQMQSSIKALLDPARAKLKSDYAAKLIDEEQMLRESYWLAQLAQAQLSSRQGQFELEERARRLALDIAAFESATRALALDDEPVNYDGLALQREHETSRAQTLNAEDDIDALERGLDEMNRAVARYDQIVEALEASPLLRAIDGKLAVAFIPYDNEDHVPEGAPLYTCRLAIVFCTRVGRVQAYWEGEVKQSHPVYGKELRGQLAELVLDDPASAKHRVLHSSRAPLFL